MIAMRVPAFVIIFSLRLLTDATDQEVDLSQTTAQELPTHSVSIHGCNAAYDSPNLNPPASCWPFAAVVEINGVRPAPSNKNRLVLAVSGKKHRRSLN